MSRRNNRRNNKQPKLKNKQILQLQKQFNAQSGEFLTTVDLITNPANVNTNQLTGYVETIGHFSIDCTFEGASTLNNVAMFIMYIPEGYNIDTTVGNSLSVINQHPEWIMAYKYLGSPTESYESNVGQGCQPTRLRSRVRRNLMTGDRIVLVLAGKNSAGESTYGTLWAYLKFASRIN
jgi:hypothetical protein